MVSGPKMFSFQLRGEVIDASVGPLELGVKRGGGAIALRIKEKYIEGNPLD